MSTVQRVTITICCAVCAEAPSRCSGARRGERRNKFGRRSPRRTSLCLLHLNRAIGVNRRYLIGESRLLAEHRPNDQEKEPVWTLVCAGRPYRRRSTPDRLQGSFDIFQNAAAIPVRTDLICTRMVPANLLRTPRHAQSCRLFAGSSRAQSIAEHFRDGILSSSSNSI